MSRPTIYKCLDGHYPADATIRVVFDNHSSHISKETMAYLATRPGRFEYIHTPKHGSWLNFVNGLLQDDPLVPASYQGDFKAGAQGTNP